MVVSSRTPEGSPFRCPVCGTVARLDFSDPGNDAICPRCGALLSLSATILDHVRRAIVAARGEATPVISISYETPLIVLGFRGDEPCHLATAAFASLLESPTDRDLASGEAVAPIDPVERIVARILDVEEERGEEFTLFMRTVGHVVEFLFAILDRDSEDPRW